MNTTYPRSFSDVDGELCREEIVVRLIHFWEARNFKRGNSLIGFELLFIDAMGFISANRFFRYEHVLKENSVYRLNKFMLTPAKALYKVSSNAKCVSFTDQTTMSVELGETTLPTQSFRLRPYADLAAIADQNRELFDVIGHIRFTDGDDIRQAPPVIPSPELATVKSSESVFFHLHMEDGETVRVNLWGKLAAVFRSRWNAGPLPPSVILVTTINPRTYGAVTLGSTSSTRLFFDNDIEETKRYMAKFPQGVPQTVVTTSSSAITKLETVTIAELTQFIHSATPRVAGFYCFATIVEIGLSGWNYISCTSCKSKMEKSSTSLVCSNRKCSKPTNVGLIRYRFEILVRDTTGTATFVIFDDAAKKLTARTAGELMVEITQDGGQVAPEETPSCLLDLVGRKCKFQIKVTEYNFTAIRQTFTVSRILEDNMVDAAPFALATEARIDNDNPTMIAEQKPTAGNVVPFKPKSNQPADVASAPTFTESSKKKQKLT